MPDLSIIIPARNEQFLAQTITDIIKNKRADTEVIAVLDGYWPEPPISDHPAVKIVHLPEPIGQRAAVNLGVALSDAGHVMKVDAHCAFDEGFDTKLINICRPDWTIIPRMYNLHAFDWVCDNCGLRRYQDARPNPCPECDHSECSQKTVWEPRQSRRTDFAYFDNKLRFQYWPDHEKRPQLWENDISDVMASIGACFFMRRGFFIQLGGLDEQHGSWGQLGVEIACKTWLSGGRQVVYRGTWFAHMFRTTKYFTFPYEISAKNQEAARRYSNDLWQNNRWPLQKRKLRWLIDKFAPVPSWGDPIELSVLIPARNEKFLQATIDDILKNFKSNFEILVGLDDYDPDPAIAAHARVKVYRLQKRMGMRPMINYLAGRAHGQYLMRVDAHCAFDAGYDTKLIQAHQPGNTLLGIRYELDTASWRRRERTNCDFRYLSNPLKDEHGGLRGLPWHDYKQQTKGEILAETMTISGSSWLMARDQFDGWGGLDENHGTFGQEGCEVACKTWLSGGRLLVNRDTWYAHHNRGKAPYALSRKERDKSVDYSKKLWLNDGWPLQKFSFHWLLNHFAPVPGWPQKDYTDGLKAPRQGTILKDPGKVSVETLWHKRIGISDPSKRFRLIIFFKAFDEVVKALVDGKSFDENAIQATRYYQYLKSHLPDKDRAPLTNKGRRRIIHKFKNAIQLFHDIKKNGLKSPLEAYQQDKNIILYKGYRRLVIVNSLGYQAVPIVLHKTMALAKQRPALFNSAAIGSITELGQKQFAKHLHLSTDKFWVHNYLPIYDDIFASLRRKKIKLIEFGVLRGASLRLWHAAFPRAAIYGADKNKTTWQEFTSDLDRIKVFVGRQENEQFLSAIGKHGPYDIIIDDCGHNPDTQLSCFRHMWRHLKENGYYIIEDCYRSYNANWEGTCLPSQLAQSLDLIYKNFEIFSLQFFYNLCVVRKGIKEAEK